MGTSANNDYIKEKGQKIEPIQIGGMQKIIEQMNTSLCLIECSDKTNGTGFFCLIPFPDKTKQIPVLMTNNHILSKDDITEDKIINFEMNHKKYRILIESRRVYTNEKYDITIIELKKSDGLDYNKFLEIDDSVNVENPYIYFKEKSVYLIQLPKSNLDSEFSVGYIEGISNDKDTIQHTCSSQPGSSGSPILDYTTCKVVGIHKGSHKHKNCNVGTFIKKPLEKFYEENKNKLDDRKNEEKEIKIESKVKNNENENNNNKNYINKSNSKIIELNSNILNKNENNEINCNRKSQNQKYSTEIKSYKTPNKNENNKIKGNKKSQSQMCSMEIKGDEILNNNTDNSIYINNFILKKEKEKIDNNIDEIIIRYSKNKSNTRDLIYNRLNKLEEIEESISGDKLFGETFVKNNKYLCKIIIGNKEFELKSYLKNETDEVKKDKFQIKLKGINKVTNFSCMFCGCISLDELQGFEKINTQNITNFSYLFSYCKISFLPDISNWDTRNVIYMNHMFYHCFDLQFVPDISKWNTSKLKRIDYMFADCFNLELIEDISKWDTNNLEYMHHIFSGCKSLKSISDISNWKTSKIKSMKQLFFQCEALEFLPDISKWDTSNVIDMSAIFDLCKSLKFLPDISNWNTGKVQSMRKMFSQCESLTYLPDISKWITFNVEDMSYMFFRCSKLLELPDISKWNTTNLKDKTYIDFGCNSNLKFPNKLKNSFFENVAGMINKNPFS